MTFPLASQKKGYAWNEGFDFELLNACAIFFRIFYSGGLLRGKTSGL